MTKKEIGKIQTQLSHTKTSILNFYTIIHLVDYELFLNDIKVRYACIHAIYCIQESIYQIQKIQSDIKQLYSSIECDKIVKLRTDIDHQHFQLHLEILYGKPSLLTSLV